MEFNQKLQELRKSKGITQEELANKLYVSRTAVSKWESGRGYPGIESLKGIATFFSVTVDELISTDQVLNIAEEEKKQKEKHFCDLVYGLLDLCAAMLLFLPFFATKMDGEVISASLIEIEGIQLYLKIVFFTVVIATFVMGVLTLALQNFQGPVWIKSKTMVSLILGVGLVLLFIVSSQTYAGVFAFVLLIIKTLMLVKQR